MQLRVTLSCMVESGPLNVTTSYMYGWTCLEKSRGRERRADHFSRENPFNFVRTARELFRRRQSTHAAPHIFSKQSPGEKLCPGLCTQTTSMYVWISIFKDLRGIIDSEITDQILAEAFLLHPSFLESPGVNPLVLQCGSNKVSAQLATIVFSVRFFLFT